MRFCKSFGSTSRRSMPSINTCPSLGSYRRVSSLTNVVLPAPFAPTSAIFSPGLIVSDTSRRAYSSRSGYLNDTLRNSMPCIEWAGQGDRVGRHRHLRFQIEKGEEVAHEQRVLVQIAQAEEQRLKHVLAAAEDREIHRHRAERDLAADGAQDDPRIREVVRQRRQQSPAERGEAALLRQRLILAHELPEQTRRSGPTAARPARRASLPSRCYRRSADIRGSSTCGLRARATTAAGSSTAHTWTAR